MTTPRTVNCPRCDAPVPWSPRSPYRPFCSERCKLMDLGAWGSEKYKLSRSSQENEEDRGIPDSDAR